MFQGYNNVFNDHNFGGQCGNMPITMNQQGCDKEQHEKIADCVRKCDEFIEAYKKVEPEYQEAVAIACLVEVILYMGR